MGDFIKLGIGAFLLWLAIMTPIVVLFVVFLLLLGINPLVCILGSDAEPVWHPGFLLFGWIGVPFIYTVITVLVNVNF